MIEKLTLLPKNILNSLNICQTNIFINVYSFPTNYIVECFTPGIPRENIQITFDSNILTIKLTPNNELNKEFIIKNEYSVPFGERFLQFNDVDFATSESSYLDGKLTIKLNKSTILNNKIDIK